MPQVLGIVAEIMLDGGGDTLLLHALDIADGNLAGEKWVLTEVFKVASVHRCAVDVDTGAKEKDGSARPAVAPQFFAYASASGLSHEAARPMPRRVGDRRRRNMSSHWTVRHLEEGNIEARNGMSSKGCVTADEIDLLIEGHFADKFINTFFHSRRIVADELAGTGKSHGKKNSGDDYAAGNESGGACTLEKLRVVGIHQGSLNAPP